MTLARRLARIAAALGLGSLVLAVVAVLGAGAGVWPPLAGVATVGGAVAIALVAILDAGAALWLGRRGGGEGRLAAMGLVAGLALVGAWTMQRVSDARFPPTHDAATMDDEVPTFATIHVPADTRPEDAGVRAAMMPGDQAAVTRRVAALGHAFGWRIVARTASHIEATDISSQFGFTDAIAIQVAQGSNGVCLVAMRSVALDQGGGDGGRNAARVRGFIKSLANSVHPKPLGG